MTKKDYELFANNLNKVKNCGVNIDFTYNFLVAVFKIDNEKFNMEKFYTACYEGKHIRKSIKERLGA